jgi:hypothetical protein
MKDLENETIKTLQNKFKVSVYSLSAILCNYLFSAAKTI